MMAESLVSQLNDLSGSTLGDILQSLNKLIKTHDGDIRSNINLILANYNPRNDLGKMIKIRLIDHCKCYDELLNIFKSDDSFYLSRALQCSWFFEKSDFDSQVLVDSVFPCMSYSTRVKVLKKYSKLLKNTSVADALTTRVKHLYGTASAVILLPACSELFVNNFLEKSYSEIPSPILLKLFKIYPSTIISYYTFLLDSREKNKRVIRGLNVNEDIFSLIAAKDPLKFAELMEKYHSHIPYFKLSKRATRKFVQISYKSLKNNVLIYKRVVNWKNVTTHLDINQIADIQRSILPKTAPEFINNYSKYNEYENITDNLKKPLKQEMLISNFQKLYGKPMSEYLESLPYELVCKLPQNEIQKWVEWKLPKEENTALRAMYLMHFPAEKALPQIRKIVESIPSVYKRADIVASLFETMINLGYHDHVRPLCEYAAKRLRNEQAFLRQRILRHLLAYEDLINISDESWAFIEEMCDVFFLNGEASGFIDEIISLYSKQIHSRLVRGKPVDPHFEKLFKNIDEYYDFKLCHKTPFERQCLTLFLAKYTDMVINDTEKKIEPKNLIDLFTRIYEWNSHSHEKIFVPQLMNDKLESCFNDENMSHYLVKLFSKMCELNKQLPIQEKIPIPQWMMNKIESFFYDNTQSRFAHDILSSVKKDRELNKNLLNKIFPEFIDPSILYYKLRNEPLIVKENYDKILSKVLDKSSMTFNYKYIFKQARLYTFCGIPDLFCEYSLKVLNEKCDEFTPYTIKRNSIFVLSILLPTDKFLETISQYYPEKGEIKDYSDEGKEVFEIQSQIAKSLKNLNFTSAALEPLKKFAIGDYLKLIVGSINSVLLRMPTSEILPILKLWFDTPVSVRKHYISAYVKIAPIHKSLELLTKLFKTEKNSSLRNLLVTKSLFLFLSENTIEAFSVLKGMIEKLELSDEEVIEKLITSHDSVVDDFISEYLQTLWNLVTSCQSEPIKNKQFKIINLIDPFILRLLSNEFSNLLISQVFVKREHNLMLFAVRYLLYAMDLEQLVNVRFGYVLPHVETILMKWNNFDLKTANVFTYRNFFSGIIGMLVRESFSNDGKILSPSTVIQKFQSSILTILKEEDVLEEIILLELSNFFHATPNESHTMHHFSNYIEPMIDKAVSVYGVVAIDTIFSGINKIFAWKYNNQQNQQALDLSEILLSKSSKNCLILSLKLLPSEITDSNIEKYERILNKILAINDVSIKISINHLLKTLHSNLQ